MNPKEKDPRREVLENLYALAFYNGLDNKFKGPKGKEWIDKNELTVDQALTKLSALEPKVDEEKVSMAIDAIEDAIENRRIAGHCQDKGLSIAKALIKDKKSWLK